LSLPEMKELQQLLAKRGFDVGKIDGVVGASTREAIRAMQIKYGLPPDGYPSEELLNQLRNG
jgi:peptidoglycan hydrolase-like protein with peptidoglycan-binding domain